MNVIDLSGIEKIYDPDKVPVYALRGVDCVIKEGEFTALRGPSGCGKSTLLNIIGGLDNPTTGTVKVGGQDISHLSQNDLIDFRKDNIGFVFQAYNLVPVLTARENVEFVMLMQNIPASERKARAEELLTALGLGDKMDKRPAELSGGQQQRVAVARSIASKPKFILADEPTANLDSASTNQLLDMMKELNEKENITFLFSTHDQRVIDRAKRVLSMDDGKIVEDEVR